MPRRLKIFVDGGCQPNPGRIELAVVLHGRVHFFDDLGSGASEDAEWHALRLGLRLAMEAGETHFELIGDNAHVIAQANGTAKCTGSALAHKQAFYGMAKSSPPARVRWIRRHQNLAGIALARRRGL